MRGIGLVLMVAATSLMMVGTAAAQPAEARASTICHMHDDRIVEASGLVARGRLGRGRLQTTNDSGNPGAVFTLHGGTCRTRGVTHLRGGTVDVEALAPAPRWKSGPRVLVGDIGDNARARRTIKVANVRVGDGSRKVTPRWRHLRYPDGAHDAEALLRNPKTGRVFVVTKEWGPGGVYSLPKGVRLRKGGRMRKLGRVMPGVTDGTFWPGGRRIVLRDYSRAKVYSWPGLKELASFQLPDQPQGEALGVSRDRRIGVTSEGGRQPVLKVRPPRRARNHLPG